MEDQAKHASHPKILEQFRPHIAQVLKALGHPLRLQIVEILARGEACVKTIEKESKASQSSVSQQMTVLRNAGVVSVRREANRRYYSLANPELVRLLQCLEKCQSKCSQ